MGATKYQIYTKESIELANLFKALGHPARVMALLEVVNNISEDIGIRELQEKIQLSQPTLSRHLKQMLEAGILKSKLELTSKKSTIKYRVNQEALTTIKQLLNHLMIQSEGKIDPAFDSKSGYFIHHRYLVDWQSYFTT